jgi:hypothetical protein
MRLRVHLKYIAGDALTPSSFHPPLPSFPFPFRLRLLQGAIECVERERERERERVSEGGGGGTVEGSLARAIPRLWPVLGGLLGG